MRRQPRTSAKRRWGLARQLALLQVGLVLLAGAVAVAVAVWRTDRDVEDQTGRRCLAVAESLAATPWLAQQLQGSDPTATLEPYTLGVQAATGVDFITVTNRSGTRFTHPDRTQIGKQYLGTTAPVLAGGTVVETYTGTLGPSVRAAVPIRAASGAVIGLVAVGVRVSALGPELTGRLTTIGIVGGIVLLVALAGSWLLARRVARQIRGLDAAELGLMDNYYDAVLHAVREGMLILDTRGRVQLSNAEARRLLGLGQDPRGRSVADLGLPAALTALCTGTDPVRDAIELVGDHVLVVNAAPATPPGRSGGRGRGPALGRVVTLRDHTELTDLANELGSTRDLAEALQSQSHEAANRLHAVITLVELGRSAEAITFATEELRVAQQLADQVLGRIAEPVVAAVLLGKAQVAAERGIAFQLTDDSALDPDALADAGLGVREMVSVIGNLVDNAFDALGGTPGGRRPVVRVTVRRADPDADELLVRVADSGPGLDPESARHAFDRGWTTKPADGALHGHGIGLGLVGQIARRHGGSVQVDSADGAIFTVRLGPALAAVP